MYENGQISEKVKPHPVVVNILTKVEEIIPKWKIVPTKDVIDSAFKDPVKREEVMIYICFPTSSPIYFSHVNVGFWTALLSVVNNAQIRNNKLIYQDKPRLKTALEMLRTSMSLEDSLHEVIAFLLLWCQHIHKIIRTALQETKDPHWFWISPYLPSVDWGGFWQVTLPFFVLHGEADTVTDPDVSRALYGQASSRDKTMKLYPGMWHGLTSGEPDENIEMVFSDIITWLDKRSTGDSAALTLQPLHYTDPVIKTSTTSTSTEMVNREKLQRTRSPGCYLCGFNGRRTLHHSAM